MCVAALAWQSHPRWRLVAVGNRDEYHERPAAALSRWDNGILAGKDLQAGGTWLGVGEKARFALVTNYRVPGFPQPGRASRGGLVTGWLENGAIPDGATMNPFNLFVADADAARFVTNHPAPEQRQLAPGIHGLSNGAYDAPWPKTQELCRALAHWLAGAARDLAPLFAALRRETPQPPPDWHEGQPEPHYAPVFIRNPVYGTRCSTVIAIDHAGGGIIAERRFDADGRQTGETALTFGPGGQEGETA